MLSNLIEICIILVQVGMGVVGALSMIYGLYSFSVPKFDKTIRFFCFFVTILLYTIIVVWII